MTWPIAPVHINLHFKLSPGIKEGQGMVVGLGYNFHPAGGYQFLKRFERFGRPLFQLLEDRAGNRQAQFEFRMVPQQFQ